MLALPGLVVGCVLAAAGGESGETPKVAADAVAAALAPVMAKRRTPGIALAAVKGDEVAYAVMGVRDADGKPVTPDSGFYIASCTKTFTALLLEKLAEADELELDDPLRVVLPAFALADEDVAAKLTLRDLLCHRQGLNCGLAVVLDAYSGEITDERFFRLLARERPAGRVSYTNTHFTLAARVAEAVRGKRWQDLLATELFDPLGMTRTTAYASRAVANPDYAWPLASTGSGWRRLRVKSDRTMHAAGGLCTTARDAATWVRLHLARGSLDGTELVPPDTIDDALTLQSESKESVGEIRDLELTGYGLAWQLGRFHGHRFAMHGGDYLGYAALFLFLPDDGVGVATLCNGGDGAVVRAATFTLIARLLGEPLEDLLGFLAARESPTPRAPAPPPPGATTVELGAALERLVGTYLHADLGTLTLRAEAGRLTVSLGEFPGVVRVAEAGGWQLLFDGGAQEFAARPIFPEPKDGRLVAVEVDLQGRKFTFERAAGS